MKKRGFCWCDTCGFNATVATLPEEGAQIDCQDCKREGMASFLGFDTELPAHVIEDEPMDKWAWQPPLSEQPK